MFRQIILLLIIIGKKTILIINSKITKKSLRSCQVLLKLRIWYKLLNKKMVNTMVKLKKTQE
jgi:hypothetical protein